MSESTIPFQGQTAVLDRPTAPEFDDAVSPDSGNRNKLLALGGLAAVLVLGVLAYFLVFAGGEDPAPSGSKSPNAPVPAAAGEEPVATTVKSPRLTGKNFGRDPFKALITEPVAVADAPPVGSTAGTTTTTGSGDITASPTTGGATTGTSSGATTTTDTPNQTVAHRFKVVDVAPDNSRISVKVDGKFYRNLKAGEVFADFFKVRFIGGAVNDFQFGEESFKVVGTKAVSIG